jgi:hypothetical protein
MEKVNSRMKLPHSQVEVLNFFGGVRKLTEPQAIRTLTFCLRTQYGADTAAGMCSVTCIRGTSEFVDGIMSE